MLLCSFLKLGVFKTQNQIIYTFLVQNFFNLTMGNLTFEVKIVRICVIKLNKKLFVDTNSSNFTCKKSHFL